MTCRFPGCNKPADLCDVDHTIAYPVGPTCASNLKCLCRKHHLLKTFWAGRHGWRDRQLPDGTVIWTDPYGQPHTTKPGSYTLFPTLWNPPLRWSSHRRAHSGRREPTGLRPDDARRQRTRRQDRADRINAERRLNEQQPQASHVTVAPTPPKTSDFASWLAALPPGDDTPPPF